MSQWHAQHCAWVAALERTGGEAMWRGALVLGILIGCSILASAEMQACDPVSAHPEGKIVCRPFGPSVTSSVPSHPIASSDAIQQIGQLIDKYGKPTIIAFIRAQRSGQITLSAGTGFRIFYGSPDPWYVTPQTILMDLEALRLSPAQLEPTLQEQAARMEQTRQATAQLRPRERAEAETSEKREREAKAKMKAEEERRQQAQSQQRSLENQVRRILEQPPPPDYKERILKDPDSRKIEYAHRMAVRWAV